VSSEGISPEAVADLKKDDIVERWFGERVNLQAGPNHCKKGNIQKAPCWGERGGIGTSWFSPARGGLVRHTRKDFQASAGTGKIRGDQTGRSIKKNPTIPLSHHGAGVSVNRKGNTYQFGQVK